MDPRIGIRMHPKMSWIRNTGCGSGIVFSMSNPNPTFQIIPDPALKTKKRKKFFRFHIFKTLFLKNVSVTNHFKVKKLLELSPFFIWNWSDFFSGSASWCTLHNPALLANFSLKESANLTYLLKYFVVTGFQETVGHHQFRIRPGDEIIPVVVLLRFWLLILGFWLLVI